jgi:hypothetical protein
MNTPFSFPWSLSFRYDSGHGVALLMGACQRLLLPTGKAASSVGRRMSLTLSRIASLRQCAISVLYETTSGVRLLIADKADAQRRRQWLS